MDEKEKIAGLKIRAYDLAIRLNLVKDDGSNQCDAVETMRQARIIYEWLVEITG
jgi:hypothetical protein